MVARGGGGGVIWPSAIMMLLKIWDVTPEVINWGVGAKACHALLIGNCTNDTKASIMEVKHNQCMSTICQTL